LPVIQPQISPLIASQFPAHYRDSNSAFVDFVTAYYQWLEQDYETINVTIFNASNTFSNSEYVFQSNGTANVASGQVININGPTLTVNGVVGEFTSQFVINGNTSLSVANVAQISNTIVLGNPTYVARNLLGFSDIDSTLDQFLGYFSNTYLKGMTFATQSDKRLTVKRILDLYRAKGNPRALKLLFQLIFGEDIDIYLPSQDIMKLSNGSWKVPVYLEITNSDRNISYVGQQITGLASGSTAFVDRLVRKKNGSKSVDLFFIENLTGDFITGEGLSVNNDLTAIPYVTGSLSSLVVDNGSYGFNIGDTVTLQSDYGIQGLARVANTESVTGTVQFNLANTGWGYSNQYSEILISNTIVYLSNVSTSFPSNAQSIPQFSNVIISIPGNPQANVYANTIAMSSSVNVYAIPIQGTFIPGEQVISQDGNCNGSIYTVSGNSTQTILNVQNVNNSYFTKNQVIKGLSSNATANVQYYQTDVGVISLSNTVNSQYTCLNAYYYPQLFINNLNGVFLGGELLYQSNGSANTAKGVVMGSNATVITVSVTNGAFTTSNTVQGFTSHANASVVTVGASNHVSANITGFSTGTNANISIGSVYTTETVFDYTDLLSGNNYYGIPWLEVPLNSSSLGFPKSPVSNTTNTLLVDLLNYELLQLGEVQQIYTTNPGQGYNDNPYIVLYQPGVASKLLQDYNITLSNTVGAFVVGEEVTQTVSVNGEITLNLSNTTGTFLFGETVYQASNTVTGTFIANTQTNLIKANTSSANLLSVLSPNNTVLIGNTIRSVNNIVNSSAFYVNAAPINANTSSNLVIISSYGYVQNIGNTYLFVANTGTFANNTKVYGQVSNASGLLVSQNPYSNGVAIGRVEQVYSNGSIYVKRMSLNTSFSNGYIITGQQSGTTANAYSVLTANSLYSGENCIVTANVITGNGSVSILYVIDSGFGYIDGEVLSFISQDGTRTGTAIAKLGKQGLGQGYYSDTNGQLSADKYLQDGYYYQIFSYDIESSLSPDQYSQMVSDTVHMAGTKMFGSVVKTSVSDTPVSVTGYSASQSVLSEMKVIKG
jgi:hypothetical protein